MATEERYFIDPDLGDSYQDRMIVAHQNMRLLGESMQQGHVLTEWEASIANTACFMVAVDSKIREGWEPDQARLYYCKPLHWHVVDAGNAWGLQVVFEDA